MTSTNDQGPPTQAEVEALSRELMAATPTWRYYHLLQRAALMIARLERAWLEAKANG